MAATAASNATLTRAQVEKILIQPLTQQSTFLRLGTPMFVSNGEPIKVPSLSSFGTAGYVAEGSAIPEVSAVTSEVTLLPSTVYSIKVMAKVSNELLRQSVINVESAFSTKLVSDVSRILDSAMWNGAGTAGAPLGVAKITGFTNAGTVAGTALSSGDLFDMDTSYMSAYADESMAHWALSPASFARVRKLTDNYGSRILQPSLAVGAPGTILGHPYTVTTHVPDTSILLFDRSQIAVGMDNRASITVLDQTYAENDLVGLRVTARYDVAALNAASIVKKTLT